jgi:hypothetical protein
MVESQKSECTRSGESGDFKTRWRELSWHNSCELFEKWIQLARFIKDDSFSCQTNLVIDEIPLSVKRQWPRQLKDEIKWLAITADYNFRVNQFPGSLSDRYFIFWPCWTYRHEHWTLRRLLVLSSNFILSLWWTWPGWMPSLWIKRIMTLWSYSIDGQKNLHIYRSQKVIYAFSFDQSGGIWYDLQNIEVESEYLSPDMREAPMLLASGWRHYLWISYMFQINVLSKPSLIKWTTELILNKMPVFHLAYVVVCHLMTRN